MGCVNSDESTNVRKHLLTIIFQLVRLFSRHKMDHLLFKTPRFWGDHAVFRANSIVRNSCETRWGSVWLFNKLYNCAVIYSCPLHVAQRGEGLISDD